MIARLTTVWDIGVTNILICSVGVVAAWGVLVVGVAYLKLQASYDPASTLLWSLFLLLTVAFWFHGRRAGGEILLDCGPHPLKNLFLLAAAFSLGQVILSVSSSADVSPSSDVMLRLAFAASILFTAFNHLQIGEDGIWAYGGLFRWNKVVFYRWADNGTLVLYTKGYPMTLRGALPVPSEHKEAVNAFLLRRAPQTREL